ncbi:MAG: hypothetical protein ACFB0B_08775 [Thermonemataceae bacterium]
MEKNFYFDDEEIGLAKTTSHPNFNTIVEEAFYYDLMDDFSPFGNDTGADTLMTLSDWIKENSSDEGILPWMFAYIDSFGFKYKSEDVAQLITLSEISHILQQDALMIRCMDQAIIATGFGQVKITGRINKQLKEVTQTALERQLLITKQDLTRGKEASIAIIKEYLERVETMKRDLLKLP